MKYKRNIISNIIMHILSISIGFATSILIARGLGPTNQGEFSFYVLVFGLISSYGHFGITTSTSYFMKRSKYNENDVVNTNLSLLIVLCIIYLFIVIILRNIIFSSNTIYFIVIWTFYFVSLMLSTCLMNVYMANENVYIYNRYLIVIHILKAVLICPLFFMDGISVVSVSIIYALLEIIKLILMILGINLKYKFNINFKLFKDELKYGIPLYLSALFLYLNYRVDQIMIKYYLNNTELGIYALSVTLAELAKMVPDSVVSAFTGKLYNCEENEKKNIVVKTIKLSFYMTVLISIIGVMCKPLITILYGSDYVRAGLSMIILLIGIPFLTIGKVSSVYFYTNGKTKIHMNIALMVLLLNLGLNFILIPKMGINGAALTSTLSYIFYGIIYLIFLHRYKIPSKDIILIYKKDIMLLKNYFNKLKIRLRGNKNA